MKINLTRDPEFAVTETGELGLAAFLRVQKTWS